MVWLKIRKNDIKDFENWIWRTVVVWLKIRKNDIHYGKPHCRNAVVVWLKIRKNDITCKGAHFIKSVVVWLKIRKNDINEENKPFINHKNGIKTDNRVENLEWCNQSENVTHAVKNRLIKTKLTDEQAKKIFNSQLSNRKLAEIYDINHSIVWRIKNKKAYKHLW